MNGENGLEDLLRSVSVQSVKLRAEETLVGVFTSIRLGISTVSNVRSVCVRAYVRKGVCHYCSLTILLKQPRKTPHFAGSLYVWWRHSDDP